MTDQGQGKDATMEEQYEEQGLILKQKMDAIKVVDDPTFKAIESVVQNAKDNEKALKEHIAPQKAEANKRHKHLTQLEKRLCEPFVALQKQGKQALDTYSADMRLIAEEKQRKANKEAQAQAEEIRIKQAAELESQGNAKQAEALLDAPIAPAPVAPVKDIPKRKGAREIWYVEVTEPFKVPLAYMIPDEKVLDALVKVQKGAFCVDGCVARTKMGG